MSPSRRTPSSTKGPVRASRTEAYPLLSSPLELLPAEIKLRLVSHLSVEDARSLALVSRSLQDAAESVIYRVVDTGLPSNWKPVESTFHITSGARAHMHGDPSAPPISRIVKICRTERLHTIADNVQSAFTSRPERAGWVSGLVLELAVEDGLPEKHLELVELVRQRLVSLKLRPTMYDGRPMPTSSTFATRLKKTGPFHRINQLEYVQPMDMSCYGAFSLALTIAPNIQNLTITSLLPAFPLLSDEEDEDDEFETDPGLQSLTVTDVTPSYMPIIARWVNRCRSLHKLSIHCESEGESWLDRDDGSGIEEHMSSIKLIREYANLKRLEWIGGWGSRHGLEKLCEEGFENLEVLVQSEAIQSESETYIENIHVPPFPNLKAILIPCRDTKWYRHLSPPDWGKAPPPRLSIGSHTITALRQAPNLLAVQFSSDPSLPLEGIIDSEQWCDSKSNGVLIRSYLNPTTREELFHFRRMELLVVNPRLYEMPSELSDRGTLPGNFKRLRQCTKMDHRWVDHTSYDGYPVPPEILKKMYKISDQLGEWTIPGRGLDLPQVAWDVLKKWRAKLPRRDEEGTRIITRRMTALAEAGFNPDI